MFYDDFVNSFAPPVPPQSCQTYGYIIARIMEILNRARQHMVLRQPLKIIKIGNLGEVYACMGTRTSCPRLMKTGLKNVQDPTNVIVDNVVTIS